MIGSRLGPYEVTAKLGEGGMGEVWRARDLQLGREVALKVLPEALTDDAERAARFEREAKVLASLNHPNIAQIYGLETSGEHKALVMELVEGPTLADRLAGGPIPSMEAFSIARQIAEALEEAHAKGIVHRDLKPQNVKASMEGKVKVLDFGLAKAMDASSSSSGAPVTASPTLMNSPTLTAAGTQLGVILGTAAYMAPEQARGGAVDKRADIWAFGVVLWEMLTGAKLFAADTVTDTLAGVLKTEIDLGALPETTPPAIRRLLRRCLERNPKNRLHDVADARIVLDEVLDGEADEPAGATGAPGAVLAARPAWRVPALVLGALAVGASVGWLLHPRPEPAQGELELALAVPPDEALAPDEHRGITMSADGRRQVVVVASAGGENQLLLRELDRAETRILPGTDGALEPALSPDGASVAFFQDGALRRMSISGGPTTALAEAGAESRGVTWSADGYIYFTPSTNSPLMRVSPSGGPIEPVTALDLERNERTHRWPDALPDGSAVLYTSDTAESSEFYDDARIEAVRPATGEHKVVLEGSSQARFLPPDHLLFARGGTLFAVRFDPAKLEATGTPVPLVQGVSTEVSSGAVRFATSASGSAIWIPGRAASLESRLEWREADGRTTPLDLPAERYWQIALSPDERHLAATIEQTASADLWIYDLEQGTKTRLTFSGSPTDMFWSPDGTRVGYSWSEAGGGLDLYWKPSDGSGEQELLLHSEGDEFSSQFTPDRRAVLFEQRGAGKTDADIRRLDLSSGKAEALLDASYDELLPAISPDGRWLAYTSLEDTRKSQIVVRRYPELAGKWQISIDGGAEPRWSPEGDAIYYRGSGQLYRVPVDTRSGFVAGTPEVIADEMARGMSTGTFDVARNGRVLVIRSVGEKKARQEVYYAPDLSARARRLTEPKR